MRQASEALIVGKTPPYRVAEAGDRCGDGLGDLCSQEAEVAGEQLVPCVTGQGHRDMLAGQTRYDVRRDRRRVAERLVMVVYQLVYEIDGAGLDDEFGVIRSETLGRQFSEGRLVVRGVIGEPDGEGPDGTAYPDGLHNGLH